MSIYIADKNGNIIVANNQIIIRNNYVDYVMIENNGIHVCGNNEYPIFTSNKSCFINIKNFCPNAYNIYISYYNELLDPYIIYEFNIIRIFKFQKL